MLSLLAMDDPWVRPRPTAPQLRHDVWLGLGLTVASLLTVELLRSVPGDFGNARWGEGFLWGAAITLPLVVRRRFPISVMVVCSVVFYILGERVAQVALSVVVQVALFMSIYTAWAWSRHRRRLLWWSVAVVVGMFVWLVELIVTSPFPEGSAAGSLSPGFALAVITVGVNVVYFFGAIGWGLVSHRDARRRGQLAEQAEQLRQEQELSAERAVTEERMRIARDLHDVVAHHVTGIGVQAAAARHVLDRDPASSRTALAAIEGSSRDAVREMHQLVGLLRSSGSDDTPAPRPGLDQLEVLGADAASNGVDVRVRVVGDHFAVPTAIGTSLYRVAQEAVANVRQHSTARTAEVVLRYLHTPARAVEVEVLDTGAPRHTTGTGDDRRRGFGLQGVRERAAVHAGHAEIGPRPDGGFRVRLRIPVEETAP